MPKTKMPNDWTSGWKSSKDEMLSIPIHVVSKIEGFEEFLNIERRKARALERFVRSYTQVHKAVKIQFLINGELMATLQMTDVQEAVLSIQPVDAKGNPAPVDGVPVWAVSDENVLAITPAADGMSATVTAKGPLGTAQASVTADADMGEGSKSIAGSLDVTVVASQATALNIAAGTPTDVAPAAPPAEPPA